MRFTCKAVFALLVVALTPVVAIPVGAGPAGADTSTTAFVDSSGPVPPLTASDTTVSGTNTRIVVGSSSIGVTAVIRPASGQVLAPGQYLEAKEFLFDDPLGPNPGLLVRGGNFYYWCDPPLGSDLVKTGRFWIDDVTFAQDGSPTSLAFHYEFDCGAFPFFGAFAFNSSVTYPTHAFPELTPTFSPTRAGASASKPFVVHNGGNAPLHVTSASITGSSEFTADASACTASPVPAGGDCTIPLAFNPVGSIGERSGTLLLYDDLAPAGGLGRPINLAGSVANPLGEYTPLTPARIVDTRIGQGRPGTSPLGPTASFDAQITGQGGVPASGVQAVVLNATVTAPTGDSYLTIWPTGVSRPVLSNLNYTPGATVPNLVTVALGTGGRVRVYNNAGTTHVVLDVVGYYSSSTGAFGSRFHPTAPSRVFDTRSGSGGVGTTPRGPGSVLHFDVRGKGSVPPSGATAVLMNVTATQPTGASFITVYPDDVTRPIASNLNVVPGQTVPNLVVVRIPATGVIDFYNNAGSVHLIADVVGYYDGDKSTNAGRLMTGTPARLLDTRVSSPLPFPGALRPDDGLLLSVDDLTTGALVLNVTVTIPTASGHMTVFPAEGIGVPLASNLNWTPGLTVANAVIVRVPPGVLGSRLVGFYNSAGYTHLVVDVFGYFTNVNGVVDSAADGTGTVQAEGVAPLGDNP